MDIPGYEILELLGQGGFGSVYRARQLAVQREVALKVDSRPLTTERDRRRFMREVTSAGRLSGHPNVVAVYDAGLLSDNRPYMVMELCPNGSLADRIREKGPLSPAEVRDIGVRVADAVAAAHAIGVLHRDIKPGNILVDSYGNPALADFGLAAMPQPGMESSATREALTPAYAPPEAFRMEEPSPAGDIYSIAATLYALLSGRPPHFPPEGSPSIPALITAHTRPVPDIPGAPPALTAVLRQSMTYDPAARPPSAAALREALAAADLNIPNTYGPHNSAAHAMLQPAGPGPQDAVAYGSHMPQPTGPGALPGYAFQTSQPMGRPYQQTGPGGGYGQATVASGKRGTSKGIVWGAAGLIAATILGAGVLVAFSSPGASKSGRTAVSPPVTSPAAQAPGASTTQTTQAGNLLTPAEIRRVIGLFEQASHSTQFAGMTVYPDRASANAPVPGRHAAFDEYTYQAGADAAVRQGPSVAITTGDAKVSLRSFNWDALPNLLRRAEQVLKVPKPTNRYVIVDPAWTFNGDKPTMLVYLTDDYGSGYLAADTNGSVVSTVPAGG